MRKWIPLAAASAVCLAAVAVPVAALQDDKKDKDKAKLEKELGDLQAQRSKLDSRIRELRRNLGRGGDEEHVIRLRDGGNDPETRIEIKKALDEAHKATREVLKNMPELREKIRAEIKAEHGKDLTPEQHEQIEKAIAGAHKAVEESLKNLPDIGAIVDKELRIFSDKDGKIITREGKMSPEEREKFRRSMEDMGARMKERMKGLKDLKIDVPNFREFGGGEGNSELRREMQELRREMDRLREEIRNQQGDRKKPELDTFEIL